MAVYSHDTCLTLAILPISGIKKYLQIIPKCLVREKLMQMVGSDTKVLNKVNVITCV